MEGKIYQALGKIMTDVGAIGKTQENTQQNFKFRGIDDFMNALHGLFAKNKVITLPHEIEALQEPYQYTDSRGNAKLQFRSRIHFEFHFVSTEDGSEVVADGWGEAADNGDKGYNKCKSIALKYVLMQMFLVPTADIADPDKETPEDITTEAPAPSNPSRKTNDAPIAEALKAVQGARSRAELTDIYNKYLPIIGKEPSFLKALNDKANVVK